MAAVKHTESGITVLETEGGHSSFAPRNDDEIFLLKFLMARFGRVSYERVLSGEGLLNIYESYCAQRATAPIHRSPEAVSAAARQGDALALAATCTLCSVLGAFAGDAALTFSAWEGVYLVGGLLDAVLDAQGMENLYASFVNKGRFSSLMKKVPLVRITRADIGSFGAATYAYHVLSL